MSAVVTNPGEGPRLVLKEVPFPESAANQALIKVACFSLNPGETRTAMQSPDSYIPGWDFAGVVAKAAADGSSPGEGTRVFGIVPRGSWAEYVVACSGWMAEIPEGVTNGQASTLSVAATTAEACLETGGSLLGRRVLITGASGGVGRFACQLATIAGARVYAVSRRPELERRLREDRVELMGIFSTMAAAKSAGEYDLIVESVGGESLGIAITALAENGICASCGNSSCEQTSFDARDFYLRKTNIRLQSVWLGKEMQAGNCTPRFARLIELVRDGRLRPPVHEELSWTRITEAAERLIQQKVNGKIILQVV